MFIDNVSISTFVGDAEVVSEEKKMKVFPNPTNGAFKVVVPESEKGRNTLKVLNLMGQIVFFMELNEKDQIIEINRANDWIPGVYFLTISGQNTSLSSKLVIE